jgi:hypothetical protein
MKTWKQEELDKRINNENFRQYYTTTLLLPLLLPPPDPPQLRLYNDWNAYDESNIDESNIDVSYKSDASYKTV